eukprot:4422314-Prymnesium_polylepis.1
MMRRPAFAPRRHSEGWIGGGVESAPYFCRTPAVSYPALSSRHICDRYTGELTGTTWSWWYVYT